MRHRQLLIVPLLFILAAVPAFAGHGWSNYHWGRPCSGATGCEASIRIYSSLATTNTNWYDHLYKSVFGDPANPNTANRRGWNDSSVLALSITASANDASTRSSCPWVSGAVRVCNYTYGSNGWLGLAQIRLTSGTTHISQGLAKMNDTYFNGGTYPNTEKRHVMCQEVGHDWGLGHTSENGSSQNTCMDYYRNTSNSDWTSTGPNQHDFDQLITQHHATSTNPNVSIMAAISAATDGNDDYSEPWQWGTPFHWDPKGRPNAFEVDTPGGRLITFVTWADEDGPGRGRGRGD